MGGRLKKGREERKWEVTSGRTHRSRGVRCVGWEGQENMWGGVAGGAKVVRGSTDPLQVTVEGRTNPERSWDRVVR